MFNKTHDKNLEKIRADFYSSTFSNVLKDIIVEGYGCVNTIVSKDKCDKCNENRKIEYYSKLGDTILVDCDCDKKMYKYIPVKFHMFELNMFKRSEEYNSGEASLWCEMNFENNDTYVKFLKLKLSAMYNSFEANEHKFSEVLYLAQEECQKHCDWLNNRASIKG